MRNDFIKAHIANSMFAACPSYMEVLLDTINGEEIAKISDDSFEPSHSYNKIGNVAVIAIDGATTKKNTWINAMCGGYIGYDTISKYIAIAESDSDVDTILYDVDSAGGEVAGADEVGESIFNSSKKTVTFYRNLGASAALWVFSASNELYANKTAMIGSIGVMSGYREPDSENDSIILVSKNAKNKNCSLNGDCESKIQSRIDHVESIFYGRVSRNTGLSHDAIAKDFGYGDVVSADKAKEIGFIKDVMSFDTLLKSLSNSGSTIVPTASVSESSTSDNSIEINQGADMKFDRDDLDATEANFNALVANRDTLTTRNDGLAMQLQTATTALEALEEEVVAEKASTSTMLSEAVVTRQVRVKEAFASNVASEDTILAMLEADTDEKASEIALNADKTEALIQTDGGQSEDAWAGIVKKRGEK